MVLNHQRAIRVRLRPMENFLSCVRRLLRLPTGAVTVCLVTNAQIARWNRDYLHKSEPTDVLSFPVEGENNRPRSRQPIPSRAHAGAREYLGDVAIAPQIARRNARRFGRSFDEEMRILILHGTLHLMGYDHETDDGEMERLELRLRRKLGLE